MLITPAFSKKKISDLLIFGCHQNTRTPRILVIIPWQHSQKTLGELEVLFFHHLRLMQLLLRCLQIHCTAPVWIQKKKKNTVLVNLQVFWLLTTIKRSQGTIKTTNIWSYTLATQPKSILWSANWSLPTSEALVPKCKIDCSILIFIHDASTNKFKIALHIRHSFGSQHFPFHMWVPKFGAMLYAITIDRLHSARWQNQMGFAFNTHPKPLCWEGATPILLRIRGRILEFISSISPLNPSCSKATMLN